MGKNMFVIVRRDVVIVYGLRSTGELGYLFANSKEARAMTKIKGVAIM